MRLCLTCYHLWPGEALLCGHCGRSFGGRFCARRHRSPASARCCIQCGLTELTVPTGSFPLGWLPLLLLGGILLIVALSVWHAAAPTAERVSAQALVWIAIFVVFLALLPGEIGRHLRRGTSRFLRGLWRLLFWGLGYRLLRELIRSLGSDRRGRY